MVNLQATFSKATTTVDGAWRITFEVGEFAGDDVSKLAQLRDQALYVVVMTEQEALEHNSHKNE